MFYGLEELGAWFFCLFVFWGVCALDWGLNSGRTVLLEPHLLKSIFLFFFFFFGDEVLKLFA
jgi:hypothetical protein